MKPRTRRPRKLLSASLGVAAVSYVACGGSTNTVANLVLPPPADGSTPDGSGGAGGNPADAVSDRGTGGGTGGSFFDVVANLIVPPPRDAGPDGVNDAPSDGTDATRDAPSDGTDATRDAPSDGTNVTRDAPPNPFDVVANLVVRPPDSAL